MTGELRQTLRAAVDRAVRARIDWERELRCAGCGVEQVDPFTGEHRYVAACRTCADRRCKHRLRVRAPQLLLFGEEAA